MNYKGKLAMIGNAVQIMTLMNQCGIIDDDMEMSPDADVRVINTHIEVQFKAPGYYDDLEEFRHDLLSMKALLDDVHETGEETKEGADGR